jgi:signal peptidase I
MTQGIINWFKKKNKSTVEQWVEAAVIILPIVFILRTFGYGLYQVPTGSMEPTMLVGERFVADKFTIWFTSVKPGDIISFDDPTYQYSENTLVNMFERYVWGPSNWTKRVIGVPGDHMQGKIEDGVPVVYRNETKLEEPYINPYPLIRVWDKNIPTIQDMYLGNCSCTLKAYDPSKPFDQQLFYKINPDLVVKLGQPVLKYPHVPLEDGGDVFDVQLGENEYWAMGDNRQGSYDSRSWGKLDGKLIHGKIKFRILSIDNYQPWSFLFLNESWLLADLLVHPIDFWKKIRWSRCFESVS